ncbi:unnamed protein product [Chrysoparadoxa australica]
MGCTSSSSAAKEVVQEIHSNNASLRKTQDLSHNLVHEEFVRHVKQVYDFDGKKMTKGAFGTVQICTHKESGDKVALKTIRLSKLKKKESIERLLAEIDIMRRLDHPNIVRLQEVYHTKDYLFMVMDLMHGGDLAEQYVFKSESNARAIVRQVVFALRYCHDRNIAHRDLKLDNLLYASSEPGSPIKIIDFGLAVLWKDGEDGVAEHDIVGSWHYVAPEVMSGVYDPKQCDMWSLGVIVYMLLSGKSPFHAPSVAETKGLVSAGRFDIVTGNWRRISEPAKNFVRRCLQKNPGLRMTAQEAQSHLWLTTDASPGEEGGELSPLDATVTGSIIDFTKQSRMKQLALAAVARTLDQTQVKELIYAFTKADVTNNGVVTLEEFKTILTVTASELPGFAKVDEEQVEGMFARIDTDGSGKLHLNEFLAATLQQQHLNEKRLMAAFQRLDRSHTGFITVEDIEFTVGTELSQAEVQGAIKQFDFDGNGRVSYEEFRRGMLAAENQ